MIEVTKGGVRLHLLIQPKSSKNEIVGPHDGRLKIKIMAPPVDGKANENVIEFISEILKIPKRDVILVRGETGRQKVVEVLGVTESFVREKLSV